MLKKMVVAIAMCAVGCGEDEEAPSCQQAMASFYGAGCFFYDTSTTPMTTTSENAALSACQQVNIGIPERCRPKFDDWKTCLAATTMADCAMCSPEGDALFACD